MDNSNYMRTDLILLEILSERKNITGFLDAIFGFLRRKTDFYHVQKDVSEKIGFAKGVREQIIFGAMQRYDPACRLNNLVTEDESSAPPAIEEVEIETEPIAEEEAKAKETMKLESKATIKTEARERESFFMPGDHKNGAVYDNYCWSQTLKDVEVHVKLPTELKTAKSLIVDIKPDHITIKNRLRPDYVILTGQLSNKYKHNDAVWTISEQKLLISFDKAKEHWWEKLFNKEKCIDLNTLDCERYIDELPEDSQAAIQKLRIQQMEQDYMAKNIMQSDEKNEQMEKLRQAWNADDSPFKGQPFDSSLIKFS